MSHPVFLSSCAFDHMPLGTLNQWKDFYHPDAFELEANSYIPILWFMLFQQENLKWAKHLDDFDQDMEQGQLDREQYFEDFEDSKESIYCYLVIPQQQALINLVHNLPIFIQIFGDQHLDYFFEFQTLIQHYYPKNILMRTSGLPLDDHETAFLVEPLRQIENLRHGNEDSHFEMDLKADLERAENLNYYFYGINHLPSSAIAETHFDENIQDDELSELDHPSSSSTIWICTGIVAISTIAVYFYSHSLLYSGLVFLISAFVLGFISSKMLSK